MRWLFVVLLVSGCVAPRFDSTEYELLAQVRVASADLATQCPTMTAQLVHDRLTTPMGIAAEQVRHRRNATVVLHADQTLLTMIESFEKMNEIGPRPSIVYCQEKLANISDGADRIMTSFASLEN